MVSLSEIWIWIVARAGRREAADVEARWRVLRGRAHVRWKTGSFEAELNRVLRVAARGTRSPKSADHCRIYQFPSQEKRRRSVKLYGQRTAGHPVGTVSELRRRERCGS